MRDSDDDSDDCLEPTQWVDAYGDDLFRYAVSRLRDRGAAEEVVQETFLAGLRFARQFSGRGSQRAWLIGILKRKIVDHLRQRSREAGDTDSDPSLALFDQGGFWRKDAATWAAAPDGELESAELWAIARDCLSRLPTGQADVFVLRVMEEMEAEAICRELSITPANLWVRLHRARLRMAECVGAKWNADKEVRHQAAGAHRCCESA